MARLTGLDTGTTYPKELEIPGITIGSSNLIGLFPQSTTKEQAFAQTNLVAGSNNFSEAPIIRLFNSNNIWWTGTGVYGVFLAIDSIIYVKRAVGIRTDKTTIPFSAFTTLR